MTTPRTADLCDAHGEAVRVLALPFRDYGGRSAFAGPVSTLKCFEDNSLVRTALEEPGNGRVLVIDGGGSLRCALVGGNLGVLAEQNGWAGVVVWGCVRDAVELATNAIGIKALGTCPRKSDKRGVGQREVPITIGGVTIRPGEWLAADEDGVIVSDAPLA